MRNITIITLLGFLLSGFFMQGCKRKSEQPSKPNVILIMTDNQACLAMALYAQIPPKDLRPEIMTQLENDIVVNHKGHLSTGMQGTFAMLDLSTRANRNDLIATIMQQTTYPSWGYLDQELGLNTCYGEIVSDWNIEKGSLSWNISVPPNSSATIYVPGNNISEGGITAEIAEGVSFFKIP